MQNKPLKIAIIDVLGLAYDGDTHKKRGLGGSESAVIYMGRELVKLGFKVTVYNQCLQGNDTELGNYAGVVYQDLSRMEYDQQHYDIVISSRSVAPFAGDHMHERFRAQGVLPKFDEFISRCSYKVLWMHDTFCDGDEMIEPLCVSGAIDRVFTLSDWHTTYVTNCTHGPRRNYEVLKPYIWQTRNGLHKYLTEVDINTKDRDLFVYNSSVTKGMVPLVTDIWPKIKARIPTAKLTVIGGYYAMPAGPDEQQKKFMELQNNQERNQALDITFTDIITQQEIAEILAKANFMVYPALFPETYGISTMESLEYNTPVITCRFGALEQVALDDACYKMDYAIGPNGLFPNINQQEQIEKFVNLTVAAYNNTYLHQQKQYACNRIKDISGWDTVALQWKQFFFHIFKRHLSRTEYRKVMRINSRVQEVFGLKHSEQFQRYTPRSIQQRMVVIVPFWNAENYLEKCLTSILSQDYENFELVLIDDASTDESAEVVKKFIQSGKSHIPVSLVERDENMGAVRNQVEVIRKLNPEDIVVLIDGDDWLAYRNDVFHVINDYYDQGAEFTYGSCWSEVDSIPLISQPYPEKVKQRKKYRRHSFTWGLPYTHLRTFRARLIQECPDHQFQDKQGQWFKAGGDGAVFYSAIERADPTRIATIPDILYVYNDTNPLNDYKISGDIQNINAENIRRSIPMDLPQTQTQTQTQVQDQKPEPTMEPSPTHTTTVTRPLKKVLIAIPTAKYIEPDTFKSIYDLDVPSDVQVDFQYFYGYRIDQVRNLIADWMIKGSWDYLFSVDSDITFPSNTLVKLMQHDKDMVTGVYRQRKSREIVEVYDGTGKNVDWQLLKQHPFVEVGGCGFGCVLIKKQVFERIPYPHFEYHVALNHENTLSEDVDFCRKTTNNGMTIWADTTIRCGHLGQNDFRLSP